MTDERRRLRHRIAGPRAGSECAHVSDRTGRRHRRLRVSSGRTSSTRWSPPATACASRPERAAPRRRRVGRGRHARPGRGSPRRSKAAGRCSTSPRWPTSTTSSPTPAAGHRGQRRRHAQRAGSGPPGRRRPGRAGQHRLGVRRDAAASASTRRRRSTPTPTGTSTCSTKIAAEMLCRDYPTLYGRPFTVLRYGIPYGPRMRPTTVLASFFRRALAGEPLRIDGDGRRSATSCTSRTWRGPSSWPSGRRRRTRRSTWTAPSRCRSAELAELTQRAGARRARSSSGPSRPGDLAARTSWSASAPASCSGWTPDVDVDEGVRRTFEWYVGGRRPTGPMRWWSVRGG